MHPDSRLTRRRLLCAAGASLLLAPFGRVSAQVPDPTLFSLRPDVQAFVADVALRNGWAEAELLQLFEGVVAQPKVIELIQPARAGFVRSWQAYRERYLDPVRVGRGLAFWDEHAAALARAEAQFGVPAEYVVAIIGVETIYGRYTGNFETLSTLATLAFDYPPRAELFRRELEALLILAREQGRPVTDYRGSYAGALGLPQFLPSSWRSYAVDYDGDGRVDLLASPVDAIGSVANFFAAHGWAGGQAVVARAHVTGEAHRALIEAGIQPRFTAEEFEAHQVRVLDDLPGPAALIDLETPDAPTEYWLGLQNFYVITRYNRSSFYAMAVHLLAQTLRAHRTAGTVAAAN